MNEDYNWHVYEGTCSTCGMKVVGISIGIEQYGNAEWFHADGETYRCIIQPLNVVKMISRNEINKGVD